MPGLEHDYSILSTYRDFLTRLVALAPRESRRRNGAPTSFTVHALLMDNLYPTQIARLFGCSVAVIHNRERAIRRIWLDLCPEYAALAGHHRERQR